MLASLRHRHQLEEMSITRPEVHAASAAPIVQLLVVGAPGRAAMDQACLLHTTEDGVKFESETWNA